MIRLIALIVLLFSTSVAAQLTNQFSASDAPVAISADEGIEWNREEKFYVARGNAQAAQGDFFISASELKAFYNEVEGGSLDVWKVTATGGVYVKNGNDHENSITNF